jgi:transcriptional regulator with XRE-family HTH domain
MQRCVPGSRKRPRTDAGRHARDLRIQIGRQIRDFRLDAGLSLRRLAELAGISHTYLAQIESATREASLSALAALSDALGTDLTIRLYPTSGPRVRDHVQARIVEELLRVIHPRWRRLTEVPVYRPTRGIIDLVLQQQEPHVVVATEVHSQVRRLEQQVGWARLKADALPSAEFWRFVDDEPRVDRLLVLRSTRANRDVAIRFEEQLRVAYPAQAAALHASVVGEAPWPGSGVLWAVVDGETVKVLDRPPRNVTLGR